MVKSKLLLIGWDAADWQIIEPLIKKGEMPTLQKLIASGVKGNLATLSPPLSPMLWTSIATGKRAYDHGIHGFVQVDKLAGKVLPVRATSRKSKAFWNVLNEAGIKTNVVNWWPSHPAEKVHGASVSNQFHKDAPAYGDDWPFDSASVFPESLADVLKEFRLHPAELTLQHVLPFIPDAAGLDPETDKVLKPLMRVLAHCVSVHNAVTYLMENTEWDCTAVYYEALDHFSHLAMKYHSPQMDGISDEDFELYKNVVVAAYRYHDMMLERLCDLAGDNCSIMLVSDHGFQSAGLREIELPDVPAAPALEHRQFGVFAANGSGCKKDHLVYGASLLDICPTILHHFDLPIGEDMEGKVLLDVFSKNQKVSKIPSWEKTCNQPQFVEDVFSVSNDMLNQLEELGYVKLAKKDAVKMAERELSYNLSASLLDGRKYERAIEVAQKEYQAEAEFRFGLIWAQALLKSGKSKELADLLLQLNTSFPGNASLDYLSGLLALREGEPKSALEHFKKIETRGVLSPSLWVEMGRALLISSDYINAEKYFDKALQMDHENVAALTGKAQCILYKAEPDGAIEILEKSLELQFFQPQAHYLMALSTWQLKRTGVAKAALSLCLQQAPKHEAAKRLMEKIQTVKPDKKEPITVVTGFPRSGTSMLMNILMSGGLPILTDEKRNKDVHNPAGYFELEDVKNLGLDNTWVSKARGKAIKVISALLNYLPSEEHYKVIWIKRPLTEVIVSQEVMRGRKAEAVMRNFPFQLAMEMQQEEKRLENWLQIQPNMEVTTLEYYDCLENPESAISTIAEFLEIPFDYEKAIKAINQKLHRNKLAK